MASPPRFPLIDAPSPLHALPRFCEALGGRVDLWAKREDLLPLAFGGNKLRNLEFLIGEALARGADTVITSGRRWSNHARLTAAAGARAGLRVHLVLSGPQVDPPGPAIRLSSSFGATLHLLPTADRAEREATVERVAAEVEAAGGRPYVIGVGGSGAIGAHGQLLAMGEILEQAAAIGLGLDRIVLPTATGGTHAGLLAGRPESMAVTGVVVARSAAELRPVIAAMVDALGSVVEPSVIDLDESQLGDGYGRRTAAAEEAAALLARTEAILVDPIYTAKALAGLVAGVRSSAWDGERIVFWHAGGLPGLFEPLD
ncbi:MAG TPA: pyridoxal-phosphate dependent enzyme [Candidatus Limnocylindrales bacterium]|nr:pyridoxal-phosphate dependent enzyme [Candidatus Limnocylindrales bacterium]